MTMLQLLHYAQEAGIEGRLSRFLPPSSLYAPPAPSLISQIQDSVAGWLPVVVVFFFGAVIFMTWKMTAPKSCLPPEPVVSHCR